MTNQEGLKKHPNYYKYDHSNVSLDEYDRLATRLLFDEAGTFDDEEMGTVYEFTSRNQNNKRCWWFVERYSGFCRITGPVPDAEFEVVEAEYRPDMYRHYFTK
jgi:hypothetical protein